MRPVPAGFKVSRVSPADRALAAPCAFFGDGLPIRGAHPGYTDEADSVIGSALSFSSRGTLLRLKKTRRAALWPQPSLRTSRADIFKRGFKP